ncbi:MAG TPA: hypothetical protein VGM70_06995 [Pseudolysinimonas sp.]|jgi:hypothetical protein
MSAHAPAPVPAPPAALPPAPGNGFALAGLLLGIVTFVIPLVVTPVLGIVFSVLGIRRGRELEAAGVPAAFTRSGMAQAALAVSITMLILNLGAIALLWWGLVAFRDAGGFSG